MKEAILYKKNNNKSIECQLCSHFCKINDNKIGICGARKNLNGLLYSLVYGYPITINIDPIEKKPLFHFFPSSETLSFGTLGCNLKCDNCQNWDISQIKKIEEHNQDLNYILPEKIVEEALGSNCKSISYTYNEPTIFTEYALDIMKLAQENNIKNVWVSNGFMSDLCLDKIIPYLDAANIDLKSINNNFYLNNCGAKLDPVLQNLRRLNNEQIHLEITTLIIPSLSSDTENFENIANFIVNELDSNIPWHISKFSPEISWKLKDLHETGDDIIYEAYDIGKEAGLKYIYTGNMPGDQRENTYCPKCGELAIGRFGYHIERMDKKGFCIKCEENLDIID
jgi:pyruvate formate lyase activating enzyme